MTSFTSHMARNLLAGASGAALMLSATTATAQGSESFDEANDPPQTENSGPTAAEAGTVVGATIVGGYLMNKAGKTGVDALKNKPRVTVDRNGTVYREISRAEAKRPARASAPKVAKPGRSAIGRGSRLDELVRRGNQAKAARVAKTGGTAADVVKARAAAAGPRNIQMLKSGANRAAIGKGSGLDDLVKRGNQAKAARTGKVAASVNRAAIGKGSSLDDLVRRGNQAKAARVAKTGGTAADVVKARAAAAGPRNIQMLKSGANRAAIGKGSGLDNLVKRGKMAQQSRATARAGAAANKGSQALGRKVLANGGDLGKLARQGDAVRAARGLGAANEAQLMRQVAGKGGDISKLNKAGRTAQVARGAGGLKAASTTSKIAKSAKMTKSASNAAKIAKVAKVGKGAAVAGKGARAAVAGTGVGVAVIAAEVVATESVEALTGMDVQDPITTGAMYGAAVFDKDIKLSDVAKDRFEHHKKNFKKFGETITTKGAVKENLRAYGQEKKENFDKSMQKLGQNMGKASKAMDAAGARNRAAIGAVTGADLVSVKDTAKQYGDALKGKNKVKGVATVAGARAKHHMDNTKKVTKKVTKSVADGAKKTGKKFGCGVGNLFRSKKNDKKC